MIKAVSVNSGSRYTEEEAVLFLVRDPALPQAIHAYRARSYELGCDEKQLTSIDALHHRVVEHQRMHGTKVAAVETVEEFDRLTRKE